MRFSDFEPGDVARFAESRNQCFSDANWAIITCFRVRLCTCNPGPAVRSGEDIICRSGCCGGLRYGEKSFSGKGGARDSLIGRGDSVIRRSGSMMIAITGLMVSRYLVI